MNTFMLYDVRYRVEKSTDQYAANREQPILDLIRDEDAAKAGRMTLCIPEAVLAPGETILREYYEDLIKELEEANIVMFTGRYARTGFAQYPIVKWVQP